MSKGVLVDISKCIGCRSCMTACKTWNNLPTKNEAFIDTWDNQSRSDATTWTVVNHYMIEDKGKVSWRYVKRQCMHCNEPACESACFTHSFVKTEEGAVIYKPTELNKDYCVGCRYCMVACPFGIPSFEWDKTFPYVLKCRFCYDRMKEGQVPACITACPTGALTYGERDEMLAEGWKRINSNPSYIKRVYGEKEYGGTSWLYISDVPFEKIGFSEKVSEKSIPSYTWDALKWTPVIFFGWGALLTAMHLYTKKNAAKHNEEEMYAPVDSDKE